MTPVGRLGSICEKKADRTLLCQVVLLSQEAGQKRSVTTNNLLESDVLIITASN